LKRHFAFLRSVRRLLVTANVVPSSLILVTLMMEALSSSETSVLIGAKRRKSPEDGILRLHGFTLGNPGFMLTQEPYGTTQILRGFPQLRVKCLVCGLTARGRGTVGGKLSGRIAQDEAPREMSANSISLLWVPLEADSLTLYVRMSHSVPWP
jgi:hypothetical protein